MSTSSSLPERYCEKAVPQLAEVLQPHVECCICFGTLYNAASCTPCLHTFCMGCISRWADTNNGRCPMCRNSVKEITPNYAFRDLVNSYLLVRPDQRRHQKDMEDLDDAELEHILKWLGSTDDRILHIESLASLQGAPELCDKKYNNMLSRAVELLKNIANRKNELGNTTVFTSEMIKPELEKLLKEVKKEVMPAAIFTKYHRVERAYRKLVKISMPMIGPAEHTWLGNFFFDRDFVDPDSSSDDDYVEDEEEYNVDMSSRVSDVIRGLQNPSLPPRRQPLPLVRGFDPVELEALSRVQNMRAPGFRRQSPRILSPTSLPPRVTRNRVSSQTSSQHQVVPTETRRPYVGTAMQTRRQHRELAAQLQPLAGNSSESASSSVRRSARLAART